MISKIIFATIATFAFGFLVNIRGKNLFFAGLSGCISSSVYLVLFQIGLGSYAATYFAAVAFALYSEVIARTNKATSTTFAFSGVLPIAPGGSLYLSMIAFVQNNISIGIAQAVSTLLNASLLALGIMSVGTFIHFIKVPKLIRIKR